MRLFIHLLITALFSVPKVDVSAKSLADSLPVYVTLLKNACKKQKSVF